MNKKLSLSVLGSAAFVALSLGACATGGSQGTSPEASAEEATTTQETSSTPQSTSPGSTPSSSQPGQTSQTGQTPGSVPADAQSTVSSASQPGMSSQSESLTPKQMTQEMVLNQLHHLNQREIQMAQMAQEKAQSPQVKSAAQELMKDHQSLELKVQEVAKAEQLELSNFQPATYEKQTMDRLGRLSGSQFDQAFMQQLQYGHRAAIEELKLAKKEVKDPQIKALIEQTLPKVSHHKQMSSGASQAGTASGT